MNLRLNELKIEWTKDWIKEKLNGIKIELNKYRLK
jgi:hypothetical protein